MQIKSLLGALAIAASVVGAQASQAASKAPAKAAAKSPSAAEWQAIFAVDKSTLASTGRNQFFVLEPGHVSVFDGAGTHLVITVLAKTELVDGVTTRVVEERETKDGALVEISRNYFVISDRDSAVYYFGENVDMYNGGKVVSHEGSWRSGVDGARFGLMMAAHPALGMRYQQEVAPKVAMDRVEFVSTTDAVKVPAGSYTGCIRTEETTPLEPGAKEYKRYCPGVGLVEDGDLKLVQLLGATAKKP